jgi:hypothetical protein
VPKEFWWAKGHRALDQNWTTGDFETWIKSTTRLRAFGVSFLRADIEKLRSAATKSAKPDASPAAPPIAERHNNSADGETGHDGTMEWDAFISHASEDKEDFVRPLADSLHGSGLRVWYDDFTLKIGDLVAPAAALVTSPMSWSWSRSPTCVS